MTDLKREINLVKLELALLARQRADLTERLALLEEQLATEEATDPWPARCPSISPHREHYRCGDWAGHPGPHTALIPTGAPWFHHKP